MKKEFRVLMLEDNAGDAELIGRELAKIGFAFTIKRVETKGGFLSALKEFKPEMVLSDYNLPDFDGLSALAATKAECPDALFIFVSGAIGEERAIEALKSGATDYVLKDRLSRFVPAVERALQEIIQRDAGNKMQENLQVGEERFRAFMDNSPAVAFLKTHEGRYVYANKPFEVRFNLTRTDWLGKTDFEFWPAQMAKHLQENDQIVLASSRSVKSTESIPTPDGGLRSWLVFKFPVIDSGESPLIGGMAVDMTDQKRLETQLKQVVGELSRLNGELDRKNEDLKKLDKLKSEFISTVSHELRTPMAIMRESIAQVMDRLCGEVTALQQQRLHMSLSNIDRLRHIIDNLLDISKFESRKVELRKEWVDLPGLVKEVEFSFEEQFKSKCLQLRYSFSKNKIEVNADKDNLIQVFMNLISNAIKFTDRGYVEIFIGENEKEIECRVTDTGCGIRVEDLPKIFNKFEQFGRPDDPGKKGTGLGLCICKEIIKLHHGEIWVESRLGHGTTFTFTLPKLSIRELFEENLSRYLQNCSKETDCLSIIIFEIHNFHTIHQKLGLKMESLQEKFVRSIEQYLQLQAGEIIHNSRFILVILPGMSKENISIISDRIHQTLDDLLSKKHFGNKIKLTIKTAEYPQGGNNAQELLEKTDLI